MLQIQNFGEKMKCNKCGRFFHHNFTFEIVYDNCRHDLKHDVNCRLCNPPKEAK